MALCACQVANTRGPYGGPKRQCVALANAFAAMAESRNRGLTEAEQIEIAIANAPDDDSDAMLGQWIRMIDLVYRFDDATPEEIGWTVIDHCEIDLLGRARVSTLWPTR